MKLTKTQLKYRTKRGAYRKEQVRALGLEFPLVKGWRKGDFSAEHIQAFVDVSESLVAQGRLVRGLATSSTEE